MGVVPLVEAQASGRPVGVGLRISDDFERRKLRCSQYVSIYRELAH